MTFSIVGNSLEDFVVGKEIGHGGSAKVLEAKSIKPGFIGKSFALKKISKSRNGQNYEQKIKNEIEIHSKLTNNYPILEFHGSFQTEDYWYIVLEFCEHGSFQNYIQGRHLSEKEACELIKKVIDGVMLLHKKGFIHRDLSLKNLLLTETFDVKIADFGLAIEVNGTTKKGKTETVGTLNFMAPEVFDGHYDFKTDCWSIGCILYELLYGKSPFNSSNSRDRNKIIKRIKNCDPKFPDYASKEAKKLLTDLLQKDMQKRIDLKAALNYDFFKKNMNKDSGMSSFSGSTSSKSRCIEHLSNDYDNYICSTYQYNKSQMKRSYPSYKLTNGQSSTAFQNHVKNKDYLPSSQVLYDSLPSIQLNLYPIKGHKPLQELNDISSQMHSFKYDNGCITSTKIQDVQKGFSQSHAPEINSIHKSSYSCHQLPEKKRIQMESIPFNKSLKDTLTPLITTRLKSRRRHIMKNIVISILNNGQVCIEILKLKKSQKYVSRIYFISSDGLQITIFNPKKKILLSDEPPIIDKLEEPEIFTFENLPQKHWKKYQYAKRFVDIVRAKTPKVTIYGNFAKCVMMENSPDPDYEIVFYDGYQISEAGCKKTIKDQNGYEVGNCCDTELLELFENMKEACKDAETYIITKQNSNFPVTIGSKPDIASIPELQDIKENVNPSCMQSSLNGTITAMKSFIYKLMANSPIHSSSQKSLPSSVSCERSMATPFRNVAETTLDLEKCKLVGENWIVTEYKDGIEMGISIEGNEYFFRDTKSQKQLSHVQRPDLIERFQRDSYEILRHALRKIMKKL